MIPKLNLEASRIKMAMQGREPVNPISLIRRAYDWFQDGLVIACSFGRCSMAVLHMALEVNPRIRVVFCDTGVEYPETYRYLSEISAAWNLNLIRLKPLKTFWQCVREYGLPIVRGKKTISGLTRQPHCCYYMKEKPMEYFCRENNVQAILTGMRAAESRVRMMAIAYHRNYFYSKRWRMWRIHPIAFWTRQQLLDYLEGHALPMNEIYKKIDRSGCMPCTAFRHWEEQLSSTNLKLYKYVQRVKGVNLIDDYLKEEQPCLEAPTEI